LSSHTRKAAASNAFVRAIVLRLAALEIFAGAVRRAPLLARERARAFRAGRVRCSATVRSGSCENIVVVLTRVWGYSSSYDSHDYYIEANDSDALMQR